MEKLVKMTRTRARNIAEAYMEPRKLEKQDPMADEMKETLEKGVYDELPAEIKEAYNILDKYGFVSYYNHVTLVTSPSDDRPQGRIENFFLPKTVTLLAWPTGVWHVSDEVFDKLTALRQQMVKVAADAQIACVQIESELMTYTYAQEAEYAHPEWFGNKKP